MLPADGDSWTLLGFLIWERSADWLALRLFSPNGVPEPEAERWRAIVDRANRHFRPHCYTMDETVQTVILRHQPPRPVPVGGHTTVADPESVEATTPDHAARTTVKVLRRRFAAKTVGRTGGKS